MCVWNNERKISLLKSFEIRTSKGVQDNYCLCDSTQYYDVSDFESTITGEMSSSVLEMENIETAEDTEDQIAQFLEYFS